jgi:hypothetical protein
MSVNPEALQKLQTAYQRATGDPCPDFYCPIMNEFGVGPRGLMDGHILPQCVRSASRATVIQRADVDNVFGRIEAVLCNFLNRPFYDVNELYKRATSLTITGSSGSPEPAFFPSPKATPPYPQILLSNPAGEIIAAPFVKTPKDRSGEFDGPVDVEGELVFFIPALAVSLIKAAHLAVFRLMGYEWALDPAGQFVGTRLATLVRRKADDEGARQLAKDLPKCFHLLPQPAISEDTLASGMLLLHFDTYDGEVHPLQHGMDSWGLSCLFNTNGYTWIVTLPFSLSRDGLADSLTRYSRYLSEPDVKHAAYGAWIRPDGAFEHSKQRCNIDIPAGR